MRPHEQIRQNGKAILVALAIPNRDLSPGEVDVLDAQTDTLDEAQSTAV